MTSDEKKEIKKNLPHGWVKIIHEKTAFSEIYIRKIMSGIGNNIEIEKAAAQLAIEHKKKQAEVNTLTKKAL